MQEGKSVNTLILRLRVIAAWGFLLMSWLLLVAGCKSAFDVMRTAGLFDWTVLLDAGFGMYGLLGFAMVSVATLLASTALAETKRRSFQLFKWTQLVSLAFLIPTFVATVAFLLGKR